MITLFSGTPGSGKSLHCADIIWDRIERCKACIVNFPINVDVIAEYRFSFWLRKLVKSMKPIKKRVGDFCYKNLDDLTVDFLYEYAKRNHKPNKESQTLLLIDECARLFNPRAWEAKDRQGWIDFFQLHRKLGYDIILISQSDRLIDRQIRAFIEYDVRHRCVNNFKGFGFVLGLAAGGKLFAAVKYWYSVREKIGTKFFRLNRKTASIYNTFEIFEQRKQAKAGKGAPAGSDRPVGVSLPAQA